MRLSGRATYKDELVKLASIDKTILCLEADLGGSNHPFEKIFPERFFNFGIAEAASIDIAAGLAKNGFTPFFSTFAPFAALRATESIKLTLGYMGFNIKIVAPYGGVSGGWFGTTHHTLEDIGILQMFPGIKIAAPYGEEETRQVVRDAACNMGPYYIRLGRNNIYPSLTLNESEQYGKSVLWDASVDGKICLISVGEEGTALALKAKEIMPELLHGHLCYIDFNSLKNSAHEMIAIAEKNKGLKFIVVEEHRPAGGVASSLSLLMPGYQIYSHNCGDNWPGHGGSHEDVLNELGFNLLNLMKMINNI